MQPNEKPLRVFVVEHRGTGGMIHYAYQLSTAMADHGAEITLVTAFEYELEQLPHNFQVVRLLKLWTRNDIEKSPGRISFINRMIRKISRFIRRIYRGYIYTASWFKLTDYLVGQKPDIIQFGKIEFPYEAFFLNYMKRKGLILAEIGHEFELRETSSRLVHNLNWLFQKMIYKNFEVIFFHAQNNLERFRELYPNTTENLYVIPLGNESLFLSRNNNEEKIRLLEEKYQLPAGSQNILFFGTITPSKGLDDLIIAFAQILPLRENARLIIAGMPTKYVEMNDYLDLIAQHNLQNAVVLDTRYIPNDEISALMELSSVVVYPYHNSTQSAALQAAYTFGKPVIATTVGGLPEVVEEGKSGLLVPPRQPDALAEAILKILDDPVFAEELGNYSRGLSETKFAWGPIGQNVLDVYCSL